MGLRIETAGFNAIQDARRLALDRGYSWPPDRLEAVEIDKDKGLSVCAMWKKKAP